MKVSSPPFTVQNNITIAGISDTLENLIILIGELT